ncbi:histone-lysine N-methyltransferase 2B-like [Empidonax traillii]|uniref:histone-lysine N-methyltransferase 2B-like n=1 Tax=Empidonax traillii TaxID=164674 RepID=UPI000FFD9849|nr:histone-lysine N-methyltransferase 2B-like [Empidonax traillii]
MSGCLERIPKPAIPPRRLDASLIDFPSYRGCQRDSARIKSIQGQARAWFIRPGSRHEQGENQEHLMEGARGVEGESGERSSSDSLMPPPVAPPLPEAPGPLPPAPPESRVGAHSPVGSVPAWICPRSPRSRCLPHASTPPACDPEPVSARLGCGVKNRHGTV